MGRRVVNREEVRQSGKNYRLGTKIGYVRDFLGGLTDVLISIYMFLILVILPLYYEDGYSYIGTNKSVFFRRCGEVMGKATIPVLILYLLTMLLVYVLQNNMEEIKKDGWNRIKSRISVTDIFAALYGISLALSYHQTEYRSSAWLGSTGWYMGFFPQMILVVSYFLISKAWRRHLWLLLTVIPVSVYIFALGVVNRFGYYPVDMKLENPEFISTIGNINWFCGYMVCIFFGVMAYYVFADSGCGRGVVKKNGTGNNAYIWKKAACLLYLLLGFTTLIVQGSSSGILAAGVVFLTLFLLSAAEGRQLQAFGECVLCLAGVCMLLWWILSSKRGTIVEDDGIFLLLTSGKVAGALLTAAVLFWGIIFYSNQKQKYSPKLWVTVGRMLIVGTCAVVIMFIGAVIINTGTGGSLSLALGLPEENFLTFSPYWASKRGATWQAAAMCFSELDLWHKVVGAGPDCMEFVVKAEGNSEILTFVETYFGKGIRLTNAHNEWFTILLNEGIFGVVSFTGMMITAIYRFLKARKDVLITGICGVCLLAYTANNMVSFQQSLNVSTIFIILAVGENYLQKCNGDKAKEN